MPSASKRLVNGSLRRPFGELAVALGPSYWIVRSPAKPRAAVIDWQRWQAAGVR